MINYLFSAINKETGFTKEQADYLVQDIKGKKTIVFVASLPDDFERSDKQLQQYIRIFSQININFIQSAIIDKRISPEDALDLINCSDIVFLLGGAPKQQMDFILEYNLMSAIKNKKFIISVSAGSMNQGKRVIYRDDFDNFSLKDYLGLGIVNINIFPHFDKENLKIVEETMELKQLQTYLLLPNNSFVRIKNNYVEIIGNYFS